MSVLCICFQITNLKLLVPDLSLWLLYIIWTFSRQLIFNQDNINLIKCKVNFNLPQPGKQAST